MENLLSRRALAATLPLAALVAAPAAALKRPPTRHPDEVLLTLVDQLDASEVRRRELDEALEEAFDRIVPPDIPGALVWRPSDFPGICRYPDRCAQYLIDDRLQYVYESRHDMPLGGLIQTLKTHTPSVRETGPVPMRFWRP